MLFYIDKNNYSYSYSTYTNSSNFKMAFIIHTEVKRFVQTGLGLHKAALYA